MAAVLQHQLRGFDPQLLDNLGGGFSKFGPEHAAELARTETRDASQPLDGEILSQVPSSEGQRALSQLYCFAGFLSDHSL